MTYLVFAGNGSGDGWHDFRGRFELMDEVTFLLSQRLAGVDTYAQVVDASAWAIIADYSAGFTPCTACKGKGYTVTWINSVDAQHRMRPVPWKVPCTACDNTGNSTTKVWKPR